jgi:hypothetical protein
MRATPREEKLGALGEVMESLEMTLKSIGDDYHDMVRGYSNTQRGLIPAYDLYDYLLGESGVWPKVVNKITIASLSYPFLKEVLGVIKRLGGELEEVGEILNEAFERENPVVYPEEFVRVSITYQNVRILMDIIYGDAYIRSLFLQGKNYWDIVSPFERTVRAFLRKVVNSNGYMEFYMGKIREYAFVSFTVADAFNGPFLPRLKKKYDKELLRTHGPTNGLQRVLFDVEKELEEKSREILRQRREREKLCLPGSLGMRVNLLGRERYNEYIEEIFRDNTKDYF